MQLVVYLNSMNPLLLSSARSENLPVPGLGRRLQFRIAELVHTGTMTFYNDLCMQSLPPAVRRLMAVEHVGPHIAVRLYEELGIDTPEKLWWAAHQQRIRKLRWLWSSQ